MDSRTGYWIRLTGTRDAEYIGYDLPAALYAAYEVAEAAGELVEVYITRSSGVTDFVCDISA